MFGESSSGPVLLASSLGHLWVLFGPIIMSGIVHFVELVENINYNGNQINRIPFDRILKCTKLQIFVLNGLQSSVAHFFLQASLMHF